MTFDDLQVNQVWKPKGWYAGGWVITAIGKNVASLKYDGDPEAKDDYALVREEFEVFFRDCDLQPHGPSFPVEV